jgi:hypothetical protein
MFGSATILKDLKRTLTGDERTLADRKDLEVKIKFEISKLTVRRFRTHLQLPSVCVIKFWMHEFKKVQEFQ